MATHSTVKDTNAPFKIIPTSRQVQVPPDQKGIGAVGDHLSEKVTFEFPTTIEGHDVAKCDRKYITWKNGFGEMGHDELELLGTDGESVYFVWTIRNALTVAKGLVEFSVHLECVAADGESIGYRWSTATCKGCEILDAVNAELGADAAMWVTGDTLVIEDYTPVDGTALSLETPGIVPEGTLEINTEGVHDVARYAQAYVKYPDAFEVPAITAGADGVITAEANGRVATYQRTAENDSDFVSENILKGKNIFGVAGSAPTPPELVGVVVKRASPATSSRWVNALYTTFEDGVVTYKRWTNRYAESTTLQCVKGTAIFFVIDGALTALTSKNGDDLIEYVEGTEGTGQTLAKVGLANEGATFTITL